MCRTLASACLASSSDLHCGCHLAVPTRRIGHAGDDAKQDLAPRLLSFWQFYHSAAPPLAKAALSVRDLLAWAGFINAVGPRIGLWAAYAHGAYLILLDGIGLGLGMAPQVRGWCLSILLCC